MNWSKLREVEEENFTRWTAHCWLIIRRISKRKKKENRKYNKNSKRKSLASIITFEYTHTSVSNLYQRMAGYPSILSNAKNSKEKDKREGESIPWLVWRKNATRLSFSPTEANSSPFMFHIYCYWPAVIVTKYIELKLRMRVIYIYIRVFARTNFHEVSWWHHREFEFYKSKKVKFDSNRKCRNVPSWRAQYKIIFRLHRESCSILFAICSFLSLMFDRMKIYYYPD